jgi:hypothetical protein
MERVSTGEALNRGRTYDPSEDRSDPARSSRTRVLITLRSLLLVAVSTATIAAFGVAVAAPSASAATLSVTDCSGSASDVGSLPYAVNVADSDGLDDTIEFGVPCPTSSPITLAATLDITANMTIEGPDANDVTVSGAGAVEDVSVGSGVTNARISGLVIEDGLAAAGGNGGGVYNAGTLNLDDVTVSGDAAGEGVSYGGAGGSGGGIYNTGTLEITDSTISDDDAGEGAPGEEGLPDAASNGGPGGAGGSGGGILNAGSLTVIGSTISGDDAGTGGAGGPGVADPGGVVVSSRGGPGGGGGDGGGIYDVGTSLAVTFTTIFGSDAGAGGQGGEATPGATVHPQIEGAGGPGGSGGAIYSNNATTTTVSTSTFSDDAAGTGGPGQGGPGDGGTGGPGGSGGAVYNASVAIVSNSTFTGDAAGAAGAGGPSGEGTGGTGGPGGSGGAIDNVATATVSSSTFTDDAAGAAGAAGEGLLLDGEPGPSGAGGAIDNESNLTITGSILAGTGSDTDNTADGELDNCAGPAPSDGGSNVEDGTTCDFSAPGSLSGDSDAQIGLQPLASNGGQTETEALLPSSVALNIVPLSSCPPTDQRGVPRPQPSSASDCDAGAYELIPPANSSTTTSSPANTPIVLGGSDTDTATVAGNSAGGSPTGTVSFYECGPTSSPVDCTSQTDPVQTDVSLTAGSDDTSSATSASFTPSAAGYWCFAAYYSGDSNYGASADTSTDECFDVTASSSTTTSSPATTPIVLGGSDTDTATVAGNSAGGSPTGTVSFYECGPGVSDCTSTANQVGTAVSVTAGSGDTSSATSASFTPASTGEWCFAALYSGDSNYSSSSDQSSDECFDVTASSSTTTSSPATTPIVLGGSDTDTATVAGNSAGGSPTGTVSFYECGPGRSDCTSTANQVATAVSVTAGSGDTSTATSASFTPTSTGIWCFAAVYSGDSNYSSSSDESSDECFTVSVASSSTVSAPASSPITLGASDSDSATVSGNSAAGSPTGTVSFYECGPTTTATDCTSQTDPVQTDVSLTAGSGDTSSATSASFTPTSTGEWCFAAVYSGDSNYSASADTSTDECFDVTASSSTTSSPATTPIVLGGSDTDTATVAGNSAAGSPTGTVSFYECGPTTTATDCTSQTDPVQTDVSLTAGSGDTSSATSAAFVPSATGYWCFAAYYSGDPNYSTSTDTTSDECFDVTTASSTTSSPTTASITIGAGDTDAVTVTGNTTNGSPTGTVTFYECGPTSSPTPCTAQTGLVQADVSLSAVGTDTSSATSSSFTPSATGYWCFAAYYSGDPNYSTSSDTTSDECFDVTVSTPAINTSQQPASATVGSSIADTATVTGLVNASSSDTVTFDLYNNPTASGTPLFTDTETVSLSGGTASATSAGYTTTATGTGYWVATFNGDSNNNAVTSGTAAEPVTVSAEPVTVTVSGSMTYGSSPSFTYVSSPSVVSGTVTCTTVDPSTAITPTLAAGDYTIDGASCSGGSASPAGDYTISYNGAANGFVVSPASTSTSTTSTSSSILLGSSDTDAATVTGNAAGGSPTGSVSFYECGPGVSDCTSTTNQVGSAVSVTAGSGDTSGATSAAFTPTSTGTWCFAAVYSGDSDYSSSSDESSDECFTVSAAASSTASSPASTAIVLGGSDTDTATVAGNSVAGSPTGTVSFYECGPTSSPVDCTSQTHPVQTDVSLTARLGDTSSATSAAFTPNATGYWCFAAVYSGDSNYLTSADTSTDECFDVTATSSTASTPASSPITLGGSDSDSATVSGNAAGGSPSGTVSFYECGPGVSDCTSMAHQVGSAVSVTAGSGDTATATSAGFTPTSTGTWCFAAVYSGDSNYSSSSDESSDECFTVGAAASSTASTPASSPITLGGSDSDSATVSGNAAGGSPSGTVSFYECGPGVSDCTSTAHQVGTAVGVTAGSGDTATATSGSFTPTSTGTWCFAAVYSGDSNYSSSSDQSSDECFTVSAGPPSAPTQLTATAGSSKIELKWVDPASNGGAAISGYDVLRSTISGGEEVDLAFVSGAGATSYTDDSVTPQVTYFYEVEARNSVGDSAPSNEASATAYTVPGTPAAPRVSPGPETVPGDGQVKVTLGAAASNGSAITGYVLTPTPTCAACTGLRPTGTSTTVAGLKPGTSYTFIEMAVNAAGAGQASTRSAAIVPTTVEGPPSTPAANLGLAGQVTLSFRPPTVTGGLPVAGYVVSISPACPSCAGTSTSGTTATVTGLTHGTTYRFEVRAVDRDGAGPASVASKPLLDEITEGYWLVTAGGHVFGLGSSPSLGGVQATSSDPAVGVAASPDGRGYFVVTADGAVSAFGDAQSFGDLPSSGVRVSDIVSIVATADGKGYWLLGADGQVYTFGDAQFQGDLLHIPGGKPVYVNDIVGMVAAPSGSGYLLIGSDGGVFAFGAVHFYGSLPGLGVHVDDIRGIIPAPGDTGYVLVGADGGAFVFGHGAPFKGSLPGRGITVTDVVGLALTTDGQGYWMAGANGVTYAFGDADQYPTPPGLAADLPVVAIAGI